MEVSGKFFIPKSKLKKFERTLNHKEENLRGTKLITYLHVADAQKKLCPDLGILSPDELELLPNYENLSRSCDFFVTELIFPSTCRSISASDSKMGKGLGCK